MDRSENLNTLDVVRQYVFDEDCDYAPNVERGRRLLDEKLGSGFWRNPLLGNEIKFYSSVKDVLGLIFQQYHIGIRVLGLNQFAEDKNADSRPDGLIWDRGVRQQAIHYGFCPNTTGHESAELIKGEEQKLAYAWKLMLSKEIELVINTFPPVTGFSGDDLIETTKAFLKDPQATRDGWKNRALGTIRWPRKP